MGGFIQNRIEKVRKRVAFAKYCFPHGDDARFVETVKQIGKRPEMVVLESGQGEDMKIPYHIFMEESHSGFFADHNRLLEYLYFADQYHLIPSVEYTEKYCYAEKHPVNGTTNPFEYYFLQPCGITPEEMLQAGTAVRSRKENTAALVKVMESAAVP